MNIAAMAQKFLALLMMISWFRVARFDLLKDSTRPTSLSSPVPAPICYLILDEPQTPPTTLLIRAIRDLAISVSSGGVA
jgi:hypothetical protein